MVEACRVYEFTFPNGKQYIGVTSNFKGRYQNHLEGKAVVSRAIRKYGDPLIKTLLIGERDYCYAMETQLIEKKGTLHPNGYNMVVGGRGGTSSLSAVTRLRMSNAQKGKSLSPETRQKLSDAGKGKKHSKATLIKLAQAATGQKHTEASKRKMSLMATGRKHTEVSKRKMSRQRQQVSLETRRKLSKAATGQVQSPETRAKIAEAQTKAWARGRKSHG